MLFSVFRSILARLNVNLALPPGEVSQKLRKELPYSASLEMREVQNMYAIIRTGGKQYRVSEGDVLNVEKLNVEEGQEVVFDEVLTVVNDGDVKVGAPTVAGAKVTAKVAKQGKADKIFVFKYRAKSNYRKRQGHRQPFTKVVIEKIEA
mgnify:FL=1